MLTPLIIVAFIYILGIVFGSYCDFPLKFSFIALILSFLFASLLFRRSPKISKLFLFLSIFLSGFVLCHLYLYPVSPAHIKNFISPWVVKLTGTIVEEPQQKGDKLSILLKCERYTPGFCNDTSSYSVKGLIKVNLLTDELTNLNLEYGDRVSLSGRLQEPPLQRNPISFNYRNYLRNKGIFAIFYCSKIDDISTEKDSINLLSSLAHKLRNFLEESIEKTLSGEEAGLLKGVMLGEKEDISPLLQDKFITTGLAHTLAVSGLHVGLVASIFYFFFRFLRFPKKISAIFNIPTVVIYCLITGANPPAVRATVLSVIILVAIIIEREPDLLNSLALAALIILLISPLSLFDASFLLSFFATLGIIYLVPFFERWFLKFFPRWIATPLSISISAQIFVAPLVAYYFNRVSIIALIANLFIVPILGIVIVIGFAQAIFCLFCFQIAKLVAIVNFAFLWYFIQAIKFFGSFPLASINVPMPSLIFIAGFYLALFAPNLKYGKLVFFSLLTLLVIFIWSKILILPGKDKLEVIFFDVGQGQSVFVHFPSRVNILIDGGDLNSGEFVLSKFLRERGIHKIDAIFSTHSHSDHLGGLVQVLEDFKIGRVFVSETEDSSPLSNIFWKFIRDNEISTNILICGDEIKIGKRAKIQIFNPQPYSSLSKDEDSLVLKLIYGKFEVLIPSDIGSSIQQGLVRNFNDMLNAEILQVPHHGSDLALNSDFLKSVKPKTAIIQFGRFNQFGFPGKEVIKTYKDLGIQVYKTARDGAIEITTDGETYSIKNYGGE